MKIAICGSMATHDLMDKMKQAATVLESMGVEPLLPAVEESASDYTGMSEAEIRARKSGYIERHFRKIEKADGILTLNYPRKGIDGYIGANTLLEMGVALYLKKKIYVLNPVKPELPCYDEVIGMSPIFLNGRLEALS